MATSCRNMVATGMCSLCPLFTDVELKHDGRRPYRCYEFHTI